MAFSDSNDLSNGSGSSTCYNDILLHTSPITTPTNNNHYIITDNHFSPEPSQQPDVAALRRLSDNLDSIFNPDDTDGYADAKISVRGGGGAGSSIEREVAIHRCVLSARSPFFKAKFAARRKERKEERKEREKEREKESGEKTKGGGSGDGGTGRVMKFELKELAGGFEVGFEALVGVLGYLYSGKLRPLPRDVCVCVDDECLHDVCRPAVNFMLESLYLSFTFEIAELVSLYQRRLLEILDKMAPDDLLLVVSVAILCQKACDRLYTKCIEILVSSDVDNIALNKALPEEIVKQIINVRKELNPFTSELDDILFPDKHVKRIHRALDSDDVELVSMLLKEGHTTLDDAFGLHYAVAYCDTKTASELLELGLADVNCRNPRGHTVLHVASTRKEPKIIISLLTKGAHPSDITPDGRKALQIAKRLTKAIDWYKPPEEGKDSHKDRLCIEILEQAERRDPVFLGEASISLAKAGDDLRSRLLYLENRVGLARLLFPMEAKVAMEIAQVDGTTEFTLSKDVRDTVDLNESLFIFKDEHRERMTALAKTVSLAKLYFPRCTTVLDKIMDTNNLAELATMGNDTQEERSIKKQRYMELQEVFAKAFNEDKEAIDWSNMSSSSSSTSAAAKHKQPRIRLKR